MRPSEVMFLALPEFKPVTWLARILHRSRLGEREQNDELSRGKARAIATKLTLPTSQHYGVLSPEARLTLSGRSQNHEPGFR